MKGKSKEPYSEGAMQLIKEQKFGEAEKTLYDALSIYRARTKENPGFYKEHPDVYDIDIAPVCKTLGVLYRRATEPTLGGLCLGVSQKELAENYYKEALDLYRKLDKAESSPGEYWEEIAEIYEDLSLLFLQEATELRFKHQKTTAD